MKTVKYKGQKFQVSNWAKFIAADKDGAVWVYDTYPDATYSPDKYMRGGSGGGYHAEKVGNLEVKRGKVKEIK